MKLCGIDPGNKGAMCVLDTSDLTRISFLDLHKHSIYDATLWLYNHQVDAIWIEDVKSFFGMSAKSNFGFGRSVGVVATISQIVTKGHVPELVAPKKWQKYIGVTTKGKAIKTNVAQIAVSLYPMADIHGPKGGLIDGRSDSLMIAHYGLHHKE